MNPIVFDDSLLTRLAAARRVVVLTGAGISAESRVATFRDPDGLWARFRPEELANVDAFLANPVMVQAWYRHRRDIVTGVQPNAAHHALVDLARLVPSFTLVTQNVDDLHRRAGSDDVLELHGNITRSTCIACGESASPEDVSASPQDDPWICASCGGLVRPDVVWFGEALPEDVFADAWTAAENADVFLSVGTSAVVYPAADLPLVAGSAGALTIEINVERSAIADHMDVVILGQAGRVLPALVTAMRTHAAHRSPLDAIPHV